MSLISKLENKVVYAVFHDDLDGVMSRIIYEYFCKRKTYDSISVNTGNACEYFDNEIMFVSDVILFVDITPTLDILETMQKNNKRVIICDHHVESYKKLKKVIDKEDYYYDINKCGTKILFDLVKPKRLKPIFNQVVDLVDVYDRWLYKDPLWSDAKGLQACLYEGLNWRSIISRNIEPTIYFKPFIIDIATKFNYYDEWIFNDRDKIKIESYKNKIQEAYKKSKKTLKKRVDNKGNTYLYFEGSSKIGLVCHRLLNEKADIDYVVVCNNFEKSSMKLSLRSTSDSGFNVGEISAKWDKSEKVISGGGHKTASGISFNDKDLFNEICKGRKHLV